ncbi:MAG: hypothetical protein QG635_134 [Bacteroidota bacterium]|nr:hypothetical protein [Bacteroidota bacterium]
MISNMLKAYKAISSAFNKPISPLVTFSGFLILKIIVSISMELDRIFCPSLRNQKIIKPIVIVGNPRSGTTFLQRFLTDNNIGVGMKLWKMIFPSLLMQSLLKPLLPLLEKISPARFHQHAAHETNLNAVETDDPALLFRFFDGFFVYGFFLAWAEEDYKDLFDPKIRDTSNRDFGWLEKIWKRNLISENHDRMAAKLFSLGVRLPRFIESFPDAKILYTIRDPLATVPSGLSLVTGVLDGRFGFWNLPENLKIRYIERLYSAFLELSLRFCEDYSNGRISPNNIKIVNYDRMMTDFENLMNEILEFIEVKPTPELIQSIHKTYEKQRNYKSGHKYDLERFGLTEERIRKDYASVYEAFFS